uniref:Mothers against decapentaplegic homolog 6-like isoform X1 n=2 Tax=Hirondellea gigas TaxID=1518452 RepID=A0A6A7GAA8_9CRUS
MLGRKKKSVIKRIWRKRIQPPESPTSSECPPSNHQSPSHPLSSQTNCFAQHASSPLSQSLATNTGVFPGSPQNNTIGNHSALKTSTLSILNQMKLEQLINLDCALEKGRTGPCVLVPNEEITIRRDIRVSPGFLSLVVWRYPSLPCDTILKSVPPCTPDHLYSCINPYHHTVSMVISPESPPPPYRERPPPPDRLRPPDQHDPAGLRYSSTRYHQSQETGGRIPTSGWMNIRYWENNRRVGQTYEVSTDTVSVLGDDTPLVSDSALCLSLLSSQCKSTEETIKIRNKIGLGILICREGSEVWLYNNSNIDVFVSSATLPRPIDDYSRIEQTRVYKVYPGHCLKVFDYDLAEHLLNISSRRTRRDGPIDVFYVNVSFCKGWGANYKRQEITNCPCWLQLHLEPPR